MERLHDMHGNTPFNGATSYRHLQTRATTRAAVGGGRSPPPPSVGIRPRSIAFAAPQKAAGASFPRGPSWLRRPILTHWRVRQAAF